MNRTHESRRLESQMLDLESRLIDFSANESADSELIEYLSEHLYIQMHMAGRSRELDARNKAHHYFSACQKLFYADDVNSRIAAISEAKSLLAA